MNQLDPRAARAIALARGGDVAGAIAAGEEALAAGLRDPGLTLFVGVMRCRQGELERGVDHLRRAVDLAPNDAPPKVELARALLALGRFAEAEQVAAPLATVTSPAGREMQRVQAQAVLSDGRAPEAAALYQQLVDADRGDFESWHGLGVARLLLSDAAGALAPIQEATRLRPSAATYWTSLAKVQGVLGDLQGSVDAARAALARVPGDAEAQIELARALSVLEDFPAALAALASALPAAANNPEMLSEIASIENRCKVFDPAETHFRAALQLRPDLASARLGLAKLLERTNRTAELLALLEAEESAEIPHEETALLKAKALRGEKRLEEALEAAEAAPAGEGEAAASRTQLIGDLADRLGDSDRAFAAFSEANALLSALRGGAAEEATAYRERFAAMTRLVTPQWYATWPKPLAVGTRRAPLFIFGFPRSGTTLIDTMLSGHPDAVVLEEEPVIDTVTNSFGALERIPSMRESEAEALRASYFSMVDAIVPAGSRLIVDKHPLGLGGTALLHRIFPNGRFVFVERHPCDVVLSCFITSTNMDAKIASFYDFTSTALLYDHVLRFWGQCEAVFDMAVHRIRYETLIADPEAELRKLAAFAGLEWDERLLAHQSNAAARSFIGSPSYAQVAEPIYTRARGRWLRYRRQMEAVMPILQPWIDRLGYSDTQAT